MTRFYGEVGFGESVDQGGGVWDDVITERTYSGNVVSSLLRFQDAEKVNDDLTLSNSISIVGDDYAFGHISSIRYIRFGGERWKIRNLEVRRPRLILLLGGVYNGPSV